MDPKKKLERKRARLLREANGLKQDDGTFKDDATRAAFDAKMTAIEDVDAQIRAIEEDDEDDDPAPPATVTPATRAEIIAQEQTRVTGIQDAVRVAGLEASVAEDLVKANKTIDQARAAIFEKLAERSAQNPTRQHIEVIPGGDATEKWLRGGVNWLLVRSGMSALVARHEGIKEAELAPGEFRGMTLLDLAKDSLNRRNIAFRGRAGMEVAGLAFRANYQTQSDFANLLETAMHKVLRAAYATQSDTWSRFCGVGSVSDFRTHNWYRLGALSVLETMNEHGEFRSKSIPDAEKTTHSAGTRGNIIGITRQVIVNDDIGFVMRLTEMFGRAGKLTIEKAVFTSLLLNSGLGPTQSDGQALFHSNRSNVNASATAITVAGIEADRAVMRSQMDPSSQEYLDLQPSVLLVPVGKRGDALTINDAQFDPADSKFQKPNTVRGLFKEVIDTPRITGTRRYLFADPTINPVFLVSFLEGQREPVLETQDGWRTDGVEMKARLDFGVDVVDYRGAVTNAGA